MAIYNMGAMHPKLAFVGVKIFATFCFWAVILVSDMLESQSRALKTGMVV